MSTDAITPFEPQSIEQMMSLATTLSKSSLLPRALQNKPSDVLIVLMTGRELGISPMQSIRGINVIDGKGVLAADLMVALAVKDRFVCEFFRLTESTEKRAAYETKRAGSEPVKMSFTIEEAQRAGLTGKNNWKNYPAAMLRARASAALARAVYPDKFFGMYDPDEMGVELPPPEKALNDPPPTVSRVAEIKGQIKATIQQAAKRVEIVDVPATPAAAEAPPVVEAKANPLPAKQEALKHWNAAVAVCHSFGIIEGKKIASTIKGATGKPSRETIDEGDVEKVRSSLTVIKEAAARAAKIVNPENNPPPPGDSDAPWNQDETPQGDGSVVV